MSFETDKRRFTPILIQFSPFSFVLLVKNICIDTAIFFRMLEGLGEEEIFRVERPLATKSATPLPLATTTSQQQSKFQARTNSIQELLFILELSTRFSLNFSPFHRKFLNKKIVFINGLLHLAVYKIQLHCCYVQFVHVTVYKQTADKTYFHHRPKKMITDKQLRPFGHLLSYFSVSY